MIFNTHYHDSSDFNGIFNVSLWEEVPNSYFSVGLHPKDLDDTFERGLAWVKEKSLYENCLAVGECGLDGLVSVSESVQEKAFEEQIIWANEIEKPMIIHCVRRFSQLMKFKKIAKIPLIVHGFNKKEAIAQELIQRGFYLSFGNALLYNKSLQEVVKNIPIENIFLETDVWDGDLRSIYHQLAEIKKMDKELIIAQIEKNVRGVFSIK